MIEAPSNTSYQFRLGDSILGAQMLFVAFGALVLVPILTGLDPNVALFTAGTRNPYFSGDHKGQGSLFSSLPLLPLLLRLFTAYRHGESRLLFAGSLQLVCCILS